MLSVSITISTFWKFVLCSLMELQNSVQASCDFIDWAEMHKNFWKIKVINLWQNMVFLIKHHQLLIDGVRAKRDLVKFKRQSQYYVQIFWEHLASICASRAINKPKILHGDRFFLHDKLAHFANFSHNFVTIQPTRQI